MSRKRDRNHVLCCPGNTYDSTDGSTFFEAADNGALVIRASAALCAAASPRVAVDTKRIAAKASHLIRKQGVGGEQCGGPITKRSAALRGQDEGSP